MVLQAKKWLRDAIPFGVPNDLLIKTLYHTYKIPAPQARILIKEMR